MDFIKELTWRGMIHNIMPETGQQLEKEMTSAYVGIDPTADSLHIGHLVSIMMLKHFQEAGHKPILLLGGATGMIGDPSGKSAERNLLDEKTLRHNQEAIKKQLEHILDFGDTAPNKAELVNNYDWMKEFSFLDFIRDIGKHITVNYMLAKDSVKKRISADSKVGLSFTEFSYQLVQGYDFLFLYNKYNCKIQMGGSDQWGNITTGTELIRRKTSGNAFAITCPLIAKADGTKFGKTSKGNIWLDPQLTTPYEFYQFWLNASDEDAEKYIKIFTSLTEEKIDSIVKEHKLEPHKRVIQKVLAREVTIMIHGDDEYNTAVVTSQILFGKGTKEVLETLNEKSFLNIFKGVPQFEVSYQKLEVGIDILELLAVQTNVFKSKGECRRMSNSISINQEKQNNMDYIVNKKDLINKKYILIKVGKKKYFLIIAN